MAVRFFSSLFTLLLTFSVACNNSNSLDDFDPSGGTDGGSSGSGSGEKSKPVPTVTPAEMAEANRLEANLDAAIRLMDEAEVEFTMRVHRKDSLNRVNDPRQGLQREVVLHILSDSEKEAWSAFSANPKKRGPFDPENFTNGLEKRRFNKPVVIKAVDKWDVPDFESFLTRLEKKQVALERFTVAAEAVLKNPRCKRHGGEEIKVQAELARDRGIALVSDLRLIITKYLETETARRERVREIMSQVLDGLAIAEVALDRAGYIFYFANHAQVLALTEGEPKIELMGPNSSKLTDEQLTLRRDALTAYLEEIRTLRADHPVLDLKENAEMVLNRILRRKEVIVKDAVKQLVYGYHLDRALTLQARLSRAGLTEVGGRWLLTSLPAVIQLGDIHEDLVAHIAEIEAILAVGSFNSDVLSVSLKVRKALLEAAAKNPNLDVREYLIDVNFAVVKEFEEKFLQELDGLDVTYTNVDEKWQRDETRYQARLKDEILQGRETQYRNLVSVAKEKYSNILRALSNILLVSLDAERKKQGESLTIKADSIF